MLPPSRASMATTCIIIAENVVHVHPVSLVPSTEARKCFNLIRVCSIGVFGRSMRPCALLFDAFCSSHASLSLCLSLCLSPLTWPCGQMESKKKRRKYSTSSNDSDTTDREYRQNRPWKRMNPGGFFFLIDQSTDQSVASWLITM